jgi:hypothetical protein
MHFRLPKPLHGWREFLGEVGIIVVGVLIALGAEQVVEDVHWHSEAGAARDALLSEARDNLDAANFRAEQQPCVERRLTEIAAIFRAHAAGQPIVLTGPIGRPIYYGGSRDAWNVAVSSQAISHMSLKQKLDFGGAFSNYENMDDVQKREQDAWLRLNVLNDPQVLAEGDWPNLHQAYAEAQSLSSRMQLITNYVLSTQSLGQPARRPPEIPGLVTAEARFCSPILPRLL